MREKTLFVAAENEPIKDIRLLKQLNKKKVKVAAGEAPRGEEKAERVDHSRVQRSKPQAS